MSSSTGLILFIGAAALFWFVFGRGGGAGAQAAVEAVRGGTRVLDVRTPGEFAGGHVKGATNIPVDQLGVRLGELGEPGPIVVYCRSGMRSARAAKVLSAAGFEVLDAGGMGRFPADLVS